MAISEAAVLLAYLETNADFADQRRARSSLAALQFC